MRIEICQLRRVATGRGGKRRLANGMTATTCRREAFGQTEGARALLVGLKEKRFIPSLTKGRAAQAAIPSLAKGRTAQDAQGEDCAAARADRNAEHR